MTDLLPEKQKRRQPHRSPPLFPSTQLLLLLHRVAHFLARFAHVFARLFQCIEFLLLRRRQDRADLLLDVLANRLDLLSRLLAERHDLGLRLVEDRLDLRLLFRREVQRLG